MSAGTDPRTDQVLTQRSPSLICSILPSSPMRRRSTPPARRVGTRARRWATPSSATTRWRPCCGIAACGRAAWSPSRPRGSPKGSLADWMRMAILNKEGEQHARLRRLVSKAFTPRAVDALRPVMRAVAHELIDGFAARGTCEFMAAFADPYPSRIICELLGIPRERYAQFHGWATDLGLAFSYAVAEHLAQIEAALQGLYACVDDLLAERRAAPGPDLVSALIAAEEAGDQLSDAELRVMVTALVFAGQDTTRNQLGCALATFLAHPAQWVRLAEEPALAARAVEEVMRVRPSSRSSGGSPLKTSSSRA